MKERSLLVGIAGGTGSGKTTVARQIHENLPDGHCARVDHDSYYRDLKDIPFEERVKVNFDHPDSLENELLAAQLAALRRNETVQKPVYDFATHCRSEETTEVKPSPIVIVEGILVLADPSLREHMDVKIFVETDADIRVFRRIRRDMDERGRSFEDIRDQYYSTVRPMHQQFVEPSRAHADIIIPEGGQNRVAIGFVIRALWSMTTGLDPSVQG